MYSTSLNTVAGPMLRELSMGMNSAAQAMILRDQMKTCTCVNDIVAQTQNHDLMNTKQSLTTVQRRSP